MREIERAAELAGDATIDDSRIKAYEGMLDRTQRRANFPYRFKHWFWEVTSWDHRNQKVVAGADWNRVVAFYPQSTTAGMCFEAVLALSDPESPLYVGDYFYGETPLRLLPYDAIVAEVPEEELDDYLERLSKAMRKPLPELGVGHDIKVGRDWADMKEVRC